MSTRKTSIESDLVKKFLIENFSKSVSELTLLDGGEMSCPFTFTVDNDAYVIRVDPYFQSYQKDKYAWEHFSSVNVPIPEMVKLGKLDNNNCFAITKKAPGKTLDRFTSEETFKIMPEIISVFDGIINTDISGTVGYGYLDALGIAKFPSWKEYILSVNDRHEEWAIKNPLIKNYEHEFERIYAKINNLSRYCPEERNLVHGDFGYNNAVSDGEKITGVLDWGESRYGDFVFDIAWLDMWQDKINYAEIFKKHFESLRINITNYTERILCYKLMNSYGALEFYIESNQFDKIDWLKEKISKLLS